MKPKHCFLKKTKNTVDQFNEVHETKKLCHRQSQDIPLDWIQFLLPEYMAYQIFLNPSDFGHTGIARKRSFIFLIHTERVDYVVDLYDLANQISRQICKVAYTQPQDYMVSNDVERSADLMQMCRTRGVPYGGLASRLTINHRVF